MEIDLYRDDGIVHVITTGVSYVGQHPLGEHATSAAPATTAATGAATSTRTPGLPSDFINFVKARSANEAWFCTDKGVGVVTDFATNTWVVYTLDPEKHTGKAVVMRDREVLKDG